VLAWPSRIRRSSAPAPGELLGIVGSTVMRGHRSDFGHRWAKVFDQI
jgi:hypothetical protein